MLRYYLLVLPVMLAQILLDEGAYRLLNVNGAATFLRTVIHLAVMVVLFVVNYAIQQRWVFSPKKDRKGE